ncbi:unnamed protein product [Rotaria sordida]|uniref:Uncharacterized protein n=1 Tax=Rotaria sordida TaxID=392033 RepID=A0A814W2S0_9BILA|nr:unnamed protein product [Rotaria sordida]CAF1199349.1 unnamed protein product [Rotaria sordida]
MIPHQMLHNPLDIQVGKIAMLSYIKLSTSFLDCLLEHEINNFRSDIILPNSVYFYANDNTIIMNRKGQVLNVTHTSEEECTQSTLNSENDFKHNNNSGTNSCYINAALQCLADAPLFVN